MAVKSMELDDTFNAGYGGVLTLGGTVEMDASIMDGATLNAGCVSTVKDIFHPITLARRVMEKTPHTFLGGEATRRLALSEGMAILPEGSLVTERAKAALEAFLQGTQDEWMSMGTVGAVAVDANGNVAAATSTGGMTGKYEGRIGDTPILGSGTYADNRFGAVSTTGYGEYIMRVNLAKSVLDRIRYLGETAAQATEGALQEMLDVTGGYTAGAITVTADGQIGVNWSSDNMAFAFQKSPSEICYGISKDHIETPICDPTA